MPYAEKRRFTGRNTDLEDRYMANGMYRYLLNGVTSASESQNIGAVENMRGNSQESITDLGLSGTIMGKIENREDNTIIYFYHDDGVISGTPEDYVYELDPIAGTLVTLLKGIDVLNFINHVTSGAVVNGQLFWTDNTEQYRKITLARGRAGEYASSSEEDIMLLRRPPYFPLLANRETDQSLNRTYLEKDSFQFTYRYIYKDGERSVFATPSKVVIVPEQSDITENVIRLNIDNRETAGGIPAFVKDIEWAFRTLATNEWAIFKRSTKEIVQASFYNDVAGATLAPEEVLLPFHDVPIRGRGLRAAENRVFVNDFVLGYNSPAISLSASITGVDPNLGTPNQTLYEVKSITINHIYNTTQGICEAIQTTGTDQYYWLDPSTGKYFKVVLSGSIADVLPGQGAGKTASDLDYVVSSTPTSPICASFLLTDTIRYLGPSLTAVVATVNVSNGRVIFKSGDTYEIGVRFSDIGGRHVGVTTNTNNARVQIPALTDPNDPDLVYPTIDWSLGPDSEIPSWATHYEIVRTRNLTRTFFVQGVAADILYGKRTPESNESALTFSKSKGSNKNLYIFIENAVKNNIGYVFSEGDRCRVVFAGITYDLSVLGQDGAWLKLELSDFGTFAAGPNQAFYEIYTPALGSLNDDFYEIGEKYEIIAGSYEKDSGSITGDVYWYIRDIYPLRPDNYSINEGSEVFEILDDPAELFLEKMNPNDRFYTEWARDEGRQTSRIRDNKQLISKNTIKYSGEAAVDSFINGTSAFHPGDEYTMPLEAGPAVALANSGNVLIHLHERETSSVYLREGFLNVDRGQKSNLVRVVEVVGDDRKLRLGYGTINPESILEYEDKVWFWDAHKGSIVRYTNEGLVAVSENGMTNYFYQLSRTLFPVKDQVKVYTGYDPYLKYFFISFAPVSSINFAGETHAYNDRTNEWVGQFSFMPQYFSLLNRFMFTFQNDGSVWKHGVNSLYNNFYGVQYTRVLRYVCNSNGSKVKIWANYRIDAESITEDLTANDIVIKLTNPTGQEGRVYAHQIEAREGVFVGDFKQDIKTPNDEGLVFNDPATEEDHWMFNGDVLRSQVTQIELTNNRDDLSPMFFSTILYRLSEASFV